MVLFTHLKNNFIIVFLIFNNKKHPNRPLIVFFCVGIVGFAFFRDNLVLVHYDTSKEMGLHPSLFFPSNCNN